MEVILTTICGGYILYQLQRMDSRLDRLIVDMEVVKLSLPKRREDRKEPDSQ